MFNKKTLLLFLILFVFSTNVYAKEGALNENGFRDMKWGESLQEITDKGIDFVELDFDTNKKLFIYIRKNDLYSIYDTHFSPIYYYLWNDKLVAVRAEFNSEKDSKAFQRIYDGLVSDFGIGKKPSSQNNTDDDLTSWQNENTAITLDYTNKDKTGILFIYSHVLQKEYADFLKTLPKSPPDYKNQPQGFADKKWGILADDLKAKGVHLIANKNKNILGDYSIANDENTFMGIPATKITYGFWEDKLWSAYVYYKNQDFDKIYRKLKELYGMPVNGRFENSTNTRYYVWPGETTYIIVYQLLNQKESYIFFASKELYDLQEKNRQNTQ